MTMEAVGMFDVKNADPQVTTRSGYTMCIWCI